MDVMETRDMSQPARRPVQLLSRELADQIAAGEVIERPGSVVKELVENSLDALARNVRVEIEGGGLDRIVVLDDGMGMDRESALLALERHATSKLATFDDLFRLSTYGFRGEALPSIASVSRFKMTTRMADALAGTEITLLSGMHVREVGAPTGTSIEVVELFYNVPARRKFIKSVATEAGFVSDMLLGLALGRPDVAFTFVRDGRIARQYLRAETREARAREGMARSLQDGTKLASELVHLVADRPATKIEAILSPPERARSGAGGLHLLVNGRAVRDRALARAVAMAYGSVLDPGRYPLGVVYVDIPSEEVDVNVHPQKAEVRFARGREVYDDVTRGLAGGLAETFRRIGRVMVEEEPTPAPRISAEARSSEPRTARGVDRGLAELSEAMGRAIAPLQITKKDSALPPSGNGDPWGIGEPANPIQPEPPVAPRAAEYTLPSAQYMVFGKSAQPPAKKADSPAQGPVQEEITLVSPSATSPATAAPQPAPSPPGAYGSLRFLAQVRATYLLCEGKDGLHVIDQHAAAERVTFAKLRAAYAKRDVPRQQLLVADVIDVSSAEAVLVDEERDTFLSFGMEASAIGDGRVAVMGIPALIRRARPGALLRDLLDEITRAGDRRFSDAADLVLATMACHGSVRAGDTLHRDECEALLRSLDDVDFAGYCPHGRPVVTSLTFAELEKKVGRR
jgi:DNA mismatch repair protein MutL